MIFFSELRLFFVLFGSLKKKKCNTGLPLFSRGVRAVSVGVSQLVRKVNTENGVNDVERAASGEL